MASLEHRRPASPNERHHAYTQNCKIPMAIVLAVHLPNPACYRSTSVPSLRSASAGRRTARWTVWASLGGTLALKSSTSFASLAA